MEYAVDKPGVLYDLHPALTRLPWSRSWRSPQGKPHDLLDEALPETFLMISAIEYPSDASQV